jgi:hypothetical protein
MVDRVGGWEWLDRCGSACVLDQCGRNAAPSERPRPVRRSGDEDLHQCCALRRDGCARGAVHRDHHIGADLERFGFAVPQRLRLVERRTSKTPRRRHVRARFQRGVGGKRTAEMDRCRRRVACERRVKTVHKMCTRGRLTIDELGETVDLFVDCGDVYGERGRAPSDVVRRCGLDVCPQIGGTNGARRARVQRRHAYDRGHPKAPTEAAANRDDAHLRCRTLVRAETRSSR